MTDKQVIDEVDVSKCKYHDRGWCLLSVSYDDIGSIRYKHCGDITLFDCYYKQLKAKEQENEKLRSKNKHLNDLLNQALKELEELQ
jgi:hypothetical protein